MFEIDNFFTPLQCEDYIYRAENVGYLMRSQTFSKDTSAKRTSTTWFLKYEDVPELLHKALTLTGKDIYTYEGKGK